MYFHEKLDYVRYRGCAIMDFLPENCRVCKDGKYKLKEFNYKKAADYLQSIGRTLHTYELYYNYCISAVYYARENNFMK